MKMKQFFFLSTLLKEDDVQFFHLSNAYNEKDRFRIKG